MRQLGSGEIHVWIFCNPEAAEEILSRDEVERAARFRVDGARRGFAGTRSVLRRVLAKYTGVEPAAIRFRYSEFGKPALEFPSGLEFNLSHSHDVVAIAVARNLPVGIDVEKLRPQPYAGAILRRFFPAAEARAFAEAEEVERLPAFFRAWTRKEAWLKARGIGIAGMGGSPGPEWRFHEFEPAPGYVAAVACAAPGQMPKICFVDNIYIP